MGNSMGKQDLRIAEFDFGEEDVTEVDLFETENLLNANGVPTMTLALLKKTQNLMGIGMLTTYAPTRPPKVHTLSRPSDTDELVFTIVFRLPKEFYTLTYKFNQETLKIEMLDESMLTED